MNQYDEKLLVSKLREGNHLAFDTLFELYFDRLFRFTVSIIKNKNDAEEIVHDVFVKVWDKRSSINTYYSFKSYLFSITYHMMISFLRKQKNNESGLDEGVDNIPDSADSAADTQLLYKEQLAMIDQLINEMPYMRRKIFRMSRYEGLSYAEIAMKFGISKNTVENHIASALKYLRKKAGDRGLSFLLALCLFLS